MAEKSRRQGRTTGLWRRLAAVLVLAFGLLSLPSVAHAAFTGKDSEALAVGAAKLIAPAASATTVTATCDRYIILWRQVRITVGGFGKVNHANVYELKIMDPAGKVVHIGDPATQAGRQFSTTGRKDDLAGKWTWELRGKYQVPGSTNVWTGEALRGQATLSCN